MRLAQLARKIGVKPSEIATFLANQNLPIEESSNAKVGDDQVEIVLKRFAPDLLIPAEVQEPYDLIEEKVKPIAVAEPLEKQEEPALEAPDKVEEIVTTQNDSASKEVIKPILVELPGLKVVGKIDLPEPKKKETENPLEDNEEVGEEKLSLKHARQKTRGKRNVNRETERRPRKNVVALQREREARETLRRKQEEKEREKELKTQRYLKKVKNYTPPPQRIKKKKHEEEYEVYTSETEKPKSLIGKILNWFVSE